MRVLLFMAVTALDDGDPPRFWGGRDEIARALGRKVAHKDTEDPDEIAERRRAFKALDRMIAALKKADAITQARAAVPGRNAVYVLNLSAERTPVSGDRSGSDAPRSADQTHPGQRVNAPRSAGQCTPVSGVPRKEEDQEEEEEETPPPLQCPRHLESPTEQPCRACGEARRRRTAWDLEREALDAEHRAAVRAWLDWAQTQPPCECGNPGGRLVRPDTGRLHCPRCALLPAESFTGLHLVVAPDPVTNDERAETTRRGAALARAHLTGKAG